jgi:signal transduction histidine kinase
VPAGGGGWIIFSLTPPDGGRLTFDSGGLFSMLAMALGIGIVAVPMVGWMTRPLRRLAEAADRVGRDPRPVMLATDGPVEVRHAAAAFNAMQARIARLIEDRTEALAALSHDLRTPLARLKLRAGFMMEGEERVRMEADIAEMEAMVSRTLEYFREGRDAEPAVPTDLAAILQTLADDAADAGHDVTYCGPAQAVLPLRRLAAKRAFTNLLNNALQHGAPPVTITLAARDAGWSTEISDAGPGIAPSEFERAVSPFVRLDAARGGSGVGLGLTIAQRFATAEGGRLTLAQAPSGGLLVQVHLPG